jgi:hypothetical protein
MVYKIRKEICLLFDLQQREDSSDSESGINPTLFEQVWTRFFNLEMIPSNRASCLMGWSLDGMNSNTSEIGQSLEKILLTWDSEPSGEKTMFPNLYSVFPFTDCNIEIKFEVWGSKTVENQ